MVYIICGFKFVCSKFQFQFQFQFQKCQFQFQFQFQKIQFQFNSNSIIFSNKQFQFQFQFQFRNWNWNCPSIPIPELNWPHVWTEYPIGLKLCRTTSGCPRIIFGKVGQSSFLCEIWHHHALYGQNCPINDSSTPWGRKYRYFCDPSSRFRDTADFNFKW